MHTSARGAWRYRTAAPAAAAVLLAGLTACGGGDGPEVAAPIPAPAARAEATSLPPATTTLVSEKYASPFVGVREAASHMPETAETLAIGFGEATKATGADSAAAEFGAKLQYLLTEYVYLSTLAMDIELVKPDDPRNSDSIKALDENSVALADAIGEVSSAAQRTQFLEGWRTATKALVDSAISNDPTVDAAAQVELDAYPKKIAKLLAQIGKGALDEDTFAAAFDKQLLALAGAHSSVKRNEDVAYRNLNSSAAGMGELAASLAQSLAKAGKLAGDITAAGALTRAALSRLLTSHVYLAVTAVLVDYSPPGVLQTESSTGVTIALGDNSTDITGAIASLAPEARLPFDRSWAAHINDVIAYAKAAEAKDQQAQTRALASLEAYRTAAGKLLNEATKGALPAADVAKAFETHIESLVGTVDAFAKRMFA